MEGRSNPMGTQRSPEVEGFQEGMSELGQLRNPIRFVRKKIGYVSAIAAVIGVAGMGWWTFVENPGKVASADIRNPSSIAKYVSANGTRPITNRIFSGLGWLSDRATKEPLTEERLSPTQNLPNAYATSSDEDDG